jgi:hypothetical protein
MSPARRPTRHRDYLVAGILMVIGLLLIYFPGRIGTDDASNTFVTLGAVFMVGGLGWGFLRLDRQVSDNPRYRQRAVYLEEEERDAGPDDQA